VSGAVGEMGRRGLESACLCIGLGVSCGLLEFSAAYHRILHCRISLSFSRFLLLPPSTLTSLLEGFLETANERNTGQDCRRIGSKKTPFRTPPHPHSATTPPFLTWFRCTSSTPYGEGKLDIRADQAVRYPAVETGHYGGFFIF